MAKLSFNELEQVIMLKSLQFKRDNLIAELNEVNALIAKCKGDEINDPKVVELPKRTRAGTDSQISERMYEALNSSVNFLTTRQVFEDIKRKHEDVNNLDKAQERKYVANLSARLSKAYTDGHIERIKENGKESIYGIKKGQQLVAP